jgi:hypothetical protein
MIARAIGEKELYRAFRNTIGSDFLFGHTRLETGLWKSKKSDSVRADPLWKLRADRQGFDLGAFI